jgi:hypothetical protein
MSVSLLLVPLSMAAVAGLEKLRHGVEVDSEQRVCRVVTRLKDASVLQDALRDTGAVVQGEDPVLRARWKDVRAEFTRDAGNDGVWMAHLDGAVDEERAVRIVAEIDRAYGSRVQAAVLDRIERQAAAARMRVESRTLEEDSSVTLVLSVESGRGEGGHP